jgi:hypothetical protein
MRDIIDQLLDDRQGPTPSNPAADLAAMEHPGTKTLGAARLKLVYKQMAEEAGHPRGFQRKFSKDAGIDEGLISKLNSGQKINISLETVEAAARGLKIDPSFFSNPALKDPHYRDFLQRPASTAPEVSPASEMPPGLEELLSSGRCGGIEPEVYREVKAWNRAHPSASADRVEVELRWQRVMHWRDRGATDMERRARRELDEALSRQAGSIKALKRKAVNDE